MSTIYTYIQLVRVRSRCLSSTSTTACIVVYEYDMRTPSSICAIGGCRWPQLLYMRAHIYPKVLHMRAHIAQYTCGNPQVDVSACAAAVW